MHTIFNKRQEVSSNSMSATSPLLVARNIERGKVIRYLLSLLLKEAKTLTPVLTLNRKRGQKVRFKLTLSETLRDVYQN